MTSLRQQEHPFAFNNGNGNSHSSLDSDAQSTGSDSSGSECEPDDSNAGNLQDQAAAETRKNLVRGETHAVRCLRVVVLLVLFLTAAGVSSAAFFVSKSVQQDSFQVDFASVATVTLRTFVESVQSQLTALDAVSSGVTSHALSTGETFPNVTVPNWEIKAATLRAQTGSIFAFFLPLVTEETRTGFEAYAKKTYTHMFASYAAEDGLRHYQDAAFGINATEAEAEADANSDGHRHRGRQLHTADMDAHPTIHDGIWGVKPHGCDGSSGYACTEGTWVKEENTGPYLPSWQMSPVLPLPGTSIFNFFDYDDLAPMLRQVLDTGKACLSYLQIDHNAEATASIIQILMTLGQYRHDTIDYDLDPLTQVAYPVFDSFDLATRKVAGEIVTTIFWRLLFSNILPESVQGVVCVLSNTLGNKATYVINGQTATLLGTGDLHDPKYNHMGLTRDVSEYVTERTHIRMSSYTSVPLDGGYTSYRIHVYPSAAFEDSHVTSEPMIYAVVVACVFILTSLFFLGYDALVEKRQAKVMDKAVKSTAVVTSLFPEAVHERLFADKEKKGGGAGKELDAWKAVSNETRASTQSDISGIMELRSSQRRETKSLQGIQLVHREKGRPIADKFPNVTVLFADLAGFTKWSSTREPDEVFVLLEAIYGAFDKVALRRQVFKVETIGDCYMACTGLPKPQPDHAVRMCKFARGCQTRLGALLDKLSEALGDDTKELQMRIGLHSGPVTAGVLRGDKGRFQLFGDTVNTASRMESNGIKGRIHVSESTAALLPENWLSEREDRIVAKGKGELLTFFVDPTNGRNSIGMRSSTGSQTCQSRRSASMSSGAKKKNDAGNQQNTMSSPQYLSNLGNFAGNQSQNVSPIDYDEDQWRDETGQYLKTQPCFGKSLAERLGITDEIEI